MPQRDDRQNNPPTDPLIGRWTYRSFISNPDIAVDFGAIEFGRGELLVEYSAPGLFIGRLTFSDDYQFRLQGTAFPSDPPTVRFQGVGDAEKSLNQVYDYFGSLMPCWPHGHDQRPTIVGSVIRSTAHNGDEAPAGVVSAFIALKR